MIHYGGTILSVILNFFRLRSETIKIVKSTTSFSDGDFAVVEFAGHQYVITICPVKTIKVEVEKPLTADDLLKRGGI